jgi:DNA polymerase-3 subunit alpha
VMTSMRDKFIQGALTNNIPKAAAAQVFDLMEQFAQYGFNKSHSTAYALLAYQTAYLKVHHPVQFMASVLTSEIGNTDKIVMYIAECKGMGIPVLPPDINESALDFRSTGGTIRFGMLAIRNVGEAAMRSVLEFRDQHGRFRSLFQFCEEVDSRTLNKRVLESVIKSGALDSLGWKRSQCMAMVDAAIEYGQRIRRDRESGQKGLFANALSGNASIAEPAPPDIPEWAVEQRLAFEKETLGFYVSGHPLDRFATEVSRFSKKSIADLISDAKSVECRIAGIVTDFRTKRTKKGDLMGIFTLEDLTGAVETVVFPNAYSKFEPYMTADCPVLVSGKFEVEEERGCKLIASDLQPLTGIAERNARTLRISASLSHLSPGSATMLHRLLESNRGDTGVDVELYNPADFRVNIQSSDFVKVKSSPELIEKIESICGPGSVRVMN